MACSMLAIVDAQHFAAVEIVYGSIPLIVKSIEGGTFCSATLAEK